MVLNMNEIQFKHTFEIRKHTREVLNIVIIAKHSNNSTIIQLLAWNNNNNIVEKAEQTLQRK